MNRPSRSKPYVNDPHDIPAEFADLGIKPAGDASSILQAGLQTGLHKFKVKYEHAKVVRGSSDTDGGRQHILIGQLNRIKWLARIGIGKGSD